MPSTSTLRKAKLTVTISGDVVNKIDEIAKEKGTPRSQVMEDMLRDSLLKSKKEQLKKTSRLIIYLLQKKRRRKTENGLR